MRFLFFAFSMMILADFSGAEPRTKEALNKKIFDDIISYQKWRYMQKIADSSQFDQDEYGPLTDLI